MRIVDDAVTGAGVHPIGDASIPGSAMNVQSATLLLWGDGIVLDEANLESGVVGAAGMYEVRFQVESDANDLQCDFMIALKDNPGAGDWQTIFSLDEGDIGPPMTGTYNVFANLCKLVLNHIQTGHSVKITAFARW